MKERAEAEMKENAARALHKPAEVSDETGDAEDDGEMNTIEIMVVQLNQLIKDDNDGFKAFLDSWFRCSNETANELAFGLPTGDLGTCSVMTLLNYIANRSAADDLDHQEMSLKIEDESARIEITTD
jgi:hypothetical protein